MQTQKYFRLLLVWTETSNNRKYVCVRRLQPILPLTRFKVLNTPARNLARRRWMARGRYIRRHPVVCLIWVTKMYHYQCSRSTLPILNNFCEKEAGLILNYVLLSGRALALWFAASGLGSSAWQYAACNRLPIQNGQHSCPPHTSDSGMKRQVL